MAGIFSIIAVLLPILGGISVMLLSPEDRRRRNVYVMSVVMLDLLVVLTVLFNTTESAVTIFKFSEELTISFRPDPAGKLFAGLVTILWPLATMYAFEYMEHEERQNSFFAFYTMTLGSVLGIAFAANLITLYVFYEMLTLFTFPLVYHPMTKEAEKAAKTYLIYSLGGAAFAFIGIVFIMIYGTGMEFQLGGVMGKKAWENQDLMRLGYVIAFCGFSVKAAMWPFSKWLTRAAVAPTPVTALLHAVAVVKSGAFAILRLTYYIYGTHMLKNTVAQYIVMTLTMITILYGSCMSVKENHFKRRLAYSTISNLSYILMAFSLMTPLGMAAGLTHMITHAIMKISSFFCCGAVMHRTGRNYVDQQDGMGYKMKLTYASFTISALSLIGVPLFAGFISKWQIADAALETGNGIGIVGIFVLIISALLTAVYMLTIVVRAYFPDKDAEPVVIKHEEGGHELPGESDPGFLMKFPLVCFSVATVLIGIFSKPLIDLVYDISGIAQWIR